VLDRLPAMQAPDGGFDYWSGATQSNPYLSRYVTHFLLEAERKGYKGPVGLIEKAKTYINGTNRSNEGGYWHGEPSSEPYLLLLKALANNKDLESMRALKLKLDSLSLEERCWLSMAFSAAGDLASAKEVLPATLGVLPGARDYGGHLRSDDKTLGLYLGALAICRPGDTAMVKVMDELSNRIKKRGYFYSTHDNAWVFMGVAKAVRGDRTGGEGMRLEWGLKGQEPRAVTLTSSTAVPFLASGKTLTLANKGSLTTHYNFWAEGWPETYAPKTENNGIGVKRFYRDLNSKETDLAKVKQGQSVVVTLEISLKEPMDNVVICDLLPAGFEIDNPRLASRGSVAFNLEEGFSPAIATTGFCFIPALLVASFGSTTVSAPSLPARTQCQAFWLKPCTIQWSMARTSRAAA
jgi:uncharacterized protein YfaS (alpha-2-macroglobulin family)